MNKMNYKITEEKLRRSLRLLSTMSKQPSCYSLPVVLLSDSGNGDDGRSQRGKDWSQ